MDALQEVQAASQVPGEPRRRWFTSRELDLIVWLDESGHPSAFQLCYDKPHAERALTWKPQTGFRHSAVDDGEADGLRYKATPILVSDGDFPSGRVGAMFAQAGVHLPPDIEAFVSSKLRDYPNRADAGQRRPRP